MGVLLSILNWLYDDSNLIKLLLIMLAVLLILMLFTGAYFNKIVGKHNYKNYRWWGSKKVLRSDWEPERPHDLTNSYDNPWDVMTGQTEEQERKTGLNLGAIIFMIAVVVAIAVVVIIIAKRMGMF